MGSVWTPPHGRADAEIGPRADVLWGGDPTLTWADAEIEGPGTNLSRHRGPKPLEASRAETSRTSLPLEPLEAPRAEPLPELTNAPSPEEAGPWGARRGRKKPPYRGAVIPMDLPVRTASNRDGVLDAPYDAGNLVRGK